MFGLPQNLDSNDEALVHILVLFLGYNNVNKDHLCVWFFFYRKGIFHVDFLKIELIHQIWRGNMSLQIKTALNIHYTV